MCVGSAQGSGVGLLFSHDCEQDCHEDVPGLYKNVYSGTKKSFFRSIERERGKSLFLFKVRFTLNLGSSNKFVHFAHN